MPNRPVQAAAEGMPMVCIEGLKTREAIEDHIERMIALLDQLDGDENMEPYLADTYPMWADREEDPAEAGIADKGALALIWPL
ncbi:hypothetical protein [Rhizobium mongolense]|uniref:Uncharacterized protein n=1 Tax=Rhizobium mongolense TaxID=57676 RepID=A0A7W6WGX5_9HYPH|nr:hypothetical protein [Rhizobium mongolense]MBB4277234.1 hypothetical protein [Rhizobium mongolense]